MAASPGGGWTPNELFELAGDLKHDVGKYVAWMSANLDERAWAGPVGPELVEALRGDILRTRTGADGRPEPVWEVWARHTRRLPRPHGIAELDDVEAAIATLRDAASVLAAADEAGIAACRDELRRAQGTIRTRLAELHRRLREEAG